jgi:hypothetical protein
MHVYLIAGQEDAEGQGRSPDPLVPRVDGRYGYTSNGISAMLAVLVALQRLSKLDPAGLYATQYTGRESVEGQIRRDPSLACSRLSFQLCTSTER